MTTLNDIEQQTKAYAAAREALAGTVMAMQDELRAIERKYLHRIKRCVAAAAEAQAALSAEIEAAPELFVKPRSVIFHGVKVGFRKGAGGLSWDDDDYVVSRIERLLPDQVDALIKTAKKPLKAALELLDAKTLKQLGVTVSDDSDVVFIKPADSDVDKVVRALLKEATEEATS